MSGGAGFGPGGASAGDAAPFSVTGPSELALDGARSGMASFTVTNETGRAVRARVLVKPGTGADAAWFRVDGDIERSLPPAGAQTVDVAINPPADAPAGPATFALAAALEEAPDREVSSAPVSFTVPEPGKRPFPWWTVIVGVVALAIVAGGGLVIWNLTRPSDPAPTSSPSPTSDVFLSDDFRVDTSSEQVDLDGDGQSDIQVDDADLSGSAIPAERPTTVFATVQGVAVVDDPTPEACRGVVLESSVQIPHAASGVFVCVFTSGEHSGVLEFGPTEFDETREVQVTLWR